MVSFLGVWSSIVFASCCVSFVNAAAPDKNAILAQLKKNGACCTALDYFLPGQVHFNLLTDLGYQSSQSSFYATQESSLHPTCIVVPTSTQNVSTAVSILSLGYQAKLKGCQFAVRSAGHTPNAGSANIDGGVTIDLQSMNQVTVSSDQKIVNIGPGNRWGNVYPKLDDLDLAMIGGRVSAVGVGGLETGGGVSFFSARYGFACDNVASYEVVLGNGSITTASPTLNPTLFKALKGGSNNFAIVTRFDAKLFQQPAFWGGAIYQPATSKDALFEFISNLTDSSTYDPYAALIASVGWVEGVPTLAHTVTYSNGDVAWPPPVFKPFDDIPKLASTMRKDHITAFTEELETTLAATNGKSNLFVTLTFVNDKAVAQDFMNEVFEMADAVAKELLTVVGLIFSFTLQPLPYTLYSKSAATGGNVLGLDRFTDDFINLLFTVSWALPTDDARVEARIQQLEASIVQKEKEKGIFNEFVYLNYAAQWQDPIQGYGADNVAFMKSVSKKYDPNGVFQKAVPGGFKLD